MDLSAAAEVTDVLKKQAARYFHKLCRVIA